MDCDDMRDRYGFIAANCDEEDAAFLFEHLRHVDAEFEALRAEVATLRAERDDLQVRLDVAIGGRQVWFEWASLAWAECDARPAITSEDAAKWLTQRMDEDGPSDGWNRVVLALRSHAAKAVPR